MRLPAFVVMLATVASPAHAQSEYGSAAYLRSVIDIGQSIWITAPDGVERLGRVTSITDSAIEMKMLVSDVSYPLEDVRLIEVPDPIINGLLVGALIGKRLHFRQRSSTWWRQEHIVERLWLVAIEAANALREMSVIPYTHCTYCLSHDNCLLP